MSNPLDRWREESTRLHDAERRAAGLTRAADFNALVATIIEHLTDEELELMDAGALPVAAFLRLRDVLTPGRHGAVLGHMLDEGSSLRFRLSERLRRGPAAGRPA